VLSQEEALTKILASVRPLAPEEVPLIDALGRFSAGELFARISLPPFDNSAMDGYAVLAASCAAGARLAVVGEQPAGVDQKLKVSAGEAIRIFTGAPLPAGADAVVMQEDVSVEESAIVLREDVQPGEFVRMRGGDVAEGQKIVEGGARIRPQTLALLAAQGFASVAVGSRPRAAVISTGDELAAAGTALQAGQIYESNSALLHALLRRSGADVVSVVHCRDDAEEIENAVRRATARADAVIISGGVSVGARDFVKSALTAAGASLDLWRVAVKPGKPFLFGQTSRCAIFGLPGNPVSAYVTFQLFVRPALLRMMGAGEAEDTLPEVRARLSEDVQNPGDRPHYIRGTLRRGVFNPVGRQESYALFGLSRSNALLRVAPGEHIVAASEVSVCSCD
jgi:molybdopterin molybdotransferase